MNQSLGKFIYNHFYINFINAFVGKKRGSQGQLGQEEEEVPQQMNYEQKFGT